MTSRALLAAITLWAAGLTGCRTEEVREVGVAPGDTLAQPPATAPAPTAGTGMGADTAVSFQLIDREGQPIGTARLTETAQGVQIAIQATNLPAGERGIHFHQTGQCEPPGFQSAGPHFAPQGRQHGLENPQGPHAGDMPNLNVGTGGSVDTTIDNPRVTLREGEQNSLLRDGGTALVIHAERDDQRTDPSGNSGDRIACGVVARTAR